MSDTQTTAGEHLVLTAIGPDRPGIVDEVSRYVFERGANIEDSRMVNLRGRFAIMMLVAGDDTTLARVRDGLGELRLQSGLQVEAHPAEPLERPVRGDTLPYRLKASAIDQPGLVHPVAHALRELGVNIESMETTLTAAPITGAPLFEMEVLMSVPASLPVTELRRTLGEVCERLNIDWQL